MAHGRTPWSTGDSGQVRTALYGPNVEEARLVRLDVVKAAVFPIAQDPPEEEAPQAHRPDEYHPAHDVLPHGGASGSSAPLGVREPAAYRADVREAPGEVEELFRVEERRGNEGDPPAAATTDRRGGGV